MTQNELIIELNNLTANWLQDVDENCAQHLTTDRLLIPIIACTTQGTTTKIAVLTKKALNAAIKPEIIVEVVLQLAPIVGILRVQQALECLQQCFDKEHIIYQRPTAEAHSNYGAQIQAKLYGTEIKDLLKNLPDKAGEFIPTALTEHFFNDFYGRILLSVAERERYELMALITLNVEFQIKAHALGSLKAGNHVGELVWSTIQLLPYIGFSQVINAVQLIQQAYQTLQNSK